MRIFTILKSTMLLAYSMHLNLKAGLVRYGMTVQVELVL